VVAFYEEGLVLKMKIGKIELDDWQLTAGGEPFRNAANTNVIALVQLERQYVNDPKYNWMWYPVFDYSLDYLMPIYQKSYGKYFAGTIEQAKNKVDNFLKKVNSLLTFG
jgi:hypothetical protein